MPKPPPAWNRPLPVQWVNRVITRRQFWRRWAVRITLPLWITALPVCVCRWRICRWDTNAQANRAIGVVQLNQHNLQVVIGPQAVGQR